MLLPLLGTSPRAPQSTASTARQPSPVHPILQQANIPSPSILLELSIWEEKK